MVKIKICGLQSRDEVLEAVKLKIDFVGFIFAESQRKVTPEKVNKMVQELPDQILKIGVFVNEDKNSLQEIAKYCKLDYVQLHGDETIEYCQDLKVKAIKAIRVKNKDSLKDLNNYPVEMILLDTYSKTAYGGTGEAFNWNLINDSNLKTPFLLAGGLNKENISKAVKIVNPFAIDVNSGVETNGRKDFVKMREFVNTVRRINYVA